MEHNILVIGNGFDLAHGLNTRYDDFMAYIKRAAAHNRTVHRILPVRQHHFL